MEKSPPENAPKKKLKFSLQARSENQNVAYVIHRAIVSNSSKTPFVGIGTSRNNQGQPSLSMGEGSIPSITLDEIFNLDREFMCNVDVIKMDIQGSEGFAMQGGASFFAECPPCFIFTELSLHLLRWYLPIEDTIALFKRYGYISSNMTVKENHVFQHQYCI